MDQLAMRSGFVLSLSIKRKQAHTEAASSSPFFFFFFLSSSGLLSSSGSGGRQNSTLSESFLMCWQSRMTVRPGSGGTL